MRRRSIVMLACALGLVAIPFLNRSDARGVAGTPIFKLSISGKSWQTGVVLNPGVKPPIGKVKAKNVTDVLTGVLPDYAASFLDLDAGGAFYLYYDGKSDWRVATNPDGDDTTPLRGQVANDGQFWFAGPYDSFLANGDVFVRGKVKFQKGTFTPKSISGKLYFVSEDITTALDLNFKTVGAAVVGM